MLNILSLLTDHLGHAEQQPNGDHHYGDKP